MILALRIYCKIVKREFLALKSIIIIIIIILIVAEVFKLEDEDVSDKSNFNASFTLDMFI